MKYDHFRCLPVEARPKMIAIWGGEYFTDGRRLKWFLLASAPGLASAITNVVWSSRWKWAIAGMIGTEWLVVAAFTALCSGMASSNWGTYFRISEPIRFWTHVGFMGLAYTLVMAGMWVGK